jgi:metalloprotein, YbeY/UPF0054 family
MMKKILEKLLKDLDYRNKELSVLFTDDNEIAALNKQYRFKTGPTNVLSFPMNEGEDIIVSDLLGDIVISIETALREAKIKEIPFTNYLIQLLIHGLLHLIGHNHENSEEEAILMETEETRLLGCVLNKYMSEVN